MKYLSVLITVVLFIGLLVAMAVNFIYINGVAAELHSMADELPESPGADTALIVSLLDYWNSCRLPASLTVAEHELDGISNGIDSLLAAALANDEASYKTSMALLHNAIDDMCRLERFSVENIF